MSQSDAVTRFEVYASPQGDYDGVFPEVVVCVEEGRQCAARTAWRLQMETTVNTCLYGIRREASADPAE